MADSSPNILFKRFIASQSEGDKEAIMSHPRTWALINEFVQLYGNTHSPLKAFNLDTESFSNDDEDPDVEFLYVTDDRPTLRDIKEIFQEKLVELCKREPLPSNPWSYWRKSVENTLIDRARRQKKGKQRENQENYWQREDVRLRDESKSILRLLYYDRVDTQEFWSRIHELLWELEKKEEGLRREEIRFFRQILGRALRRGKLNRLLLGYSYTVIEDWNAKGPRIRILEEELGKKDKELPKYPFPENLFSSMYYAYCPGTSNKRSVLYWWVDPKRRKPTT